MASLFERMQNYLPLLLTGLRRTVAVSLLALVLATALGLVWAMLRTSHNAWLERPARFLVKFLRGIPILVVLFYIYFAMPEIGLDLSTFQAGVIGVNSPEFLGRLRVSSSSAVRTRRATASRSSHACASCCRISRCNRTRPALLLRASGRFCA